MANESFLLVSLDDDKSKHLAQVLSNDTARKILDIMSKEETMTETEIADALKIPLSTVHYNMSLLVKSDLVKDEHYKYSKKGKKIVHYSLSKKYVVITPKKSDNIISKLREFLPVVLILAAISYSIKLFMNPSTKTAGFKAEALYLEAGAAATEVITQPQYAYWFLIGGIVALVLYFIWNKFVSKKDRNF